MSGPSELDEALERLLNRTLRGLPLRRAPLTLEARVLHELECRSALPWWRRSFTHWPHGARTVFALTCVALVAQSMVIMSAAQELGASLARAIPSGWISASLALCALLYASLFGLGIAAYRALYLSPKIAGDRS